MDEAKPAAKPETKPPFNVRTAARASYAITGLLAVVLIISAAGVWNVGITTTYPLRQAIEWNWRARATNNLIDMARYLNESIEILGRFHGNPAWSFPTPDTDLDSIRTNIVESRDTALAVAASESIGSFGYQQAVQNLQETIVEINEHLAIAKGWFVRSQVAVVLAIAYVALSLLAVLVTAGVRVVDRQMAKRPLQAIALVWCFGTIAVVTLLFVIP